MNKDVKKDKNIFQYKRTWAIIIGIILLIVICKSCVFTSKTVNEIKPSTVIVTSEAK